MYKVMYNFFGRKPPRADGTGGLGRPELLTRLGENNIVVFNHITDPGIRRKIVRTKLAVLEEDLRERFGLRLEISDACLDWLDTQNRQGCGGRDLINIIERDLINPMSNFRHIKKCESIITRGMSGPRQRVRSIFECNSTSLITAMQPQNSPHFSDYTLLSWLTTGWKVYCRPYYHSKPFLNHPRSNCSAWVR